MATSPFSPNTSVQTTYEMARGRAMPGERPRANIYQDRPKENCVYDAVNANQITEITITAAAASEAVAISIDGAAVQFTSAASVNGTATAGAAALDAAAGGGMFFEGVIDTEGTSAAAAVITLAFVTPGLHVVAFVPKVGGTTTATVANTTTGASSVVARPGTVAVYSATQDDPSVTKVAQPSPSNENNRPVGVVVRSPYSSNQTPPNPWGLDEAGGWPPGVLHREWQKAEVEVLIAGDVEPGQAAYFVLTAGADNGKFIASDGSDPGTGQVSELTVTPSAGDNVSILYDALPATTPFASVDLATDSAALRDAINSNAAYAAILASPATVVANKVVLNFVPGAAHVFSDESVPDASVAELITTVAVAPTAATAAPYPGATFTESRTAVQGTAVVDLG